MKGGTTALPRVGGSAVICAMAAGKTPGGKEIPRYYNGRIIYVNYAHRWYLVEADLDGTVLRESFKF